MFLTFKRFSTSVRMNKTMSFFFHNHNGIPLLMFDNLCIIPQRLSIKLTTVATIHNIVQ